MENRIPEHIISTIKTLLQPYTSNVIEETDIVKLVNPEAHEPKGERDELLTLAEAAKLLRCSKPTIQSYAKKGILEIVKPDPESHKAYVLRNSIKWHL